MARSLVRDVASLVLIQLVGLAEITIRDRFRDAPALVRMTTFGRVLGLRGRTVHIVRFGYPHQLHPPLWSLSSEACKRVTDGGRDEFAHPAERRPDTREGAPCARWCIETPKAVTADVIHDGLDRTCDAHASLRALGGAGRPRERAVAGGHDPFTFIELRVNADGEGEGTLSRATRVAASGDGRFIHLENWGVDPVRLTEVERQ